jgi:hypothetical protein
MQRGIPDGGGWMFVGWPAHVPIKAPGEMDGRECTAVLQSLNDNKIDYQWLPGPLYCRDVN